MPPADDVPSDVSLPDSPLVGPTPFPASSNTSSVLSRIPQDVQQFRERLFALDEPIALDRDSFNKCWPYIDNIWCLHNRHDAIDALTNGKTNKFWGGCRLQRRWDHSNTNTPPKGVRNRVRRETGTCQAKFKLTVMPNGVHVLERSTKDEHSHDLDHIDAMKRNSGVRSLVLDPFFNSWEAAGIMAYLRDPAHYINGRDMLNEAGGKYLERREIMNVFAQHLRKSHPGLDVTTVKKEQEKYKAVKMCNFKGCNKAFPDARTLAAHRKAEHAGRKHDHSNKMYTCPCKGCHRKKRSKGFVSITALREHQIKSQHWGEGTFHSEDGPTSCPAVTEEDAQRLLQEAEAQADAGASEAAETAALLHAQLNQHEDAPPAGPSLHSPHMPNVSPYPMHQVPPRHATPPHEADIRLLPMLHHQQQAEAALQQHHQQQQQQGNAANLLHIDPAMQPQVVASPRPGTGFRSSRLAAAGQPLDDGMRQDLMDRYIRLQREMDEVKGVLFGP